MPADSWHLPQHRFCGSPLSPIRPSPVEITAKSGSEIIHHARFGPDGILSRHSPYSTVSVKSMEWLRFPEVAVT